MPVIDGFTAVSLTSAPVLVGAGLSVAGLGSALISPGSGGIPVAYFPITGGEIDTETFGGTIEHEGSGLALSNSTTTVELENFLINTLSGTLFGDVTVGSTTLLDVALFSIGASGNAAYPFALTLTAGAAGTSTSFLGAPDLTGAQIGIASTTPVTSAVPEVSTYLMMLGGIGLLGLVGRRRLAREPQEAATA